MAIVLPGELRSQTAGTGIGDIQEMYSTASGTWIAQDLTDIYGGMPAVASSAVSAFALSSGDYERVFYLDTNKHVEEMYSTASGTWVPQDLTAGYNGVPAGPEGALSAFALSSGDYERVFYLDANGHVQEMYSTASGTWVAQDLTAGYNGVPAAAGSALSAFALSSGDNERVFYLDANGHVQQMYSTASGTWVHQDLTAGYNGVPAAAGSALSAFALRSGDNERVFYLDANGHVQEMYSTASGTWVAQDLTAGYNGVPAAAGSALSAFALGAGDYERVFYLDANGHVQQMYSTANGTWVHQDLMAGSSGSALSAFALSTGDYERVFYLDTNGHVQEIYSTASGSWVHQDLTAGYDGVPTSIRSAISAFALSSGDYERVFFLQGYTLSGHVLAGGSALPGATVTLTGATAAGTSVSLSTTTDSNGNYFFTVPAGGTYIATPSLAGYTFNPASQTFTDVAANQSASVMISTFNITGQWNQASQYPATWNLTQNGNTVTGTASATVCGMVTWQVSGNLINANTGEYQLTATNPSTPTDLCGNSAATQQNEDLTLSGNSTTGWSLDESVFSSGTVSGESTWTKAGSTDTVQISSSPGIPLNGSNTITVTSSSLPITLTIQTETGSGAAALGPSSNGPFFTGSVILNASPTTLYVYGETVSSTANNISITATSSTAPSQYQKVYLTVVSVSLTMRNSGTLSQDYPQANLPSFVPYYGAVLGSQVVKGPPGRGPYCAQVMEYDGIVTPANYKGVIALTRTKNGVAYNDSTGSSDGLTGSDTSDAGILVTTPTANGEIFDFDAPGIPPPPMVNGQNIDIARQRIKFVETASLDDASGATLATLNTFARSSCIGPSSSPSFSNLIQGDNTSGIGTTPLTWNLQ